jgi:D-inositol-3-phosphate glycosyltransferase
MNVYVVETSKRLAALGVEVEVFTRATSSELPPVVELAPGVTVRHITAGPFEGPVQGGPAGAAVRADLRRAARRGRARAGWYDVVHSHYWLSGQVGWLATERWGVPLVHTAHTLAKVKNLALADGRRPRAAAPGGRRAAGGRRPPTGWWPTPPTRRASWSTSTAPRSSGWSPSRRASTSSTSGR